MANGDALPAALAGAADGRIELVMGANLSTLPQSSDTHLTAAEMDFKGKTFKETSLELKDSTLPQTTTTNPSYPFIYDISSFHQIANCLNYNFNLPSFIQVSSFALAIAI